MDGNYEGSGEGFVKLKPAILIADYCHRDKFRGVLLAEKNKDKITEAQGATCFLLMEFYILIK